MKKIYTLLIALFFIGGAMGQGCLPEGITFETQAQIDSFQINYPGCTEIEGYVVIQGDYNPNSDIKNLTGLNVLTSIQEHLWIRYNDSLGSLEGLDNLTSIGFLYVFDNDMLTDLSGLEGLTSTEGGLWIERNNNLSTLTGLEGLNTISSRININNNNNLISLAGLDNLTSIDDDLWIIGNNDLIDLSGLEDLQSIQGNLKIQGNHSLTDLSGLDNIISIGGTLTIDYNSSIINLTGMPELTSISGLRIQSNNALANLTGLEVITSIDGGVYLWSNFLMTNLNGLNNLTSIGGGLTIHSDTLLNDISALQNLNSIGGDIYIAANYSLYSLDGLENIDANTIENLHIEGNLNLSLCEVQSVCDYIANPNGYIDIQYNAQGCNNQQQVEDACETVSVEEHNSLIDATIYPNPTHSTITIELPTQPSHNTSLTISSTNGQQLIIQPITKPQTEIDVSHLPVGIYIIKVWNDKDVMVRKIIKQ